MTDDRGPVTTRELNRATLARQMLLARHDVTVEDAVARLIGLQAQVPKPPFIGLWTRIEHFQREALLDAVRRRTVVRATMMRATLHLMTADDYLTFRRTIQPALDRGLTSVLGARNKGLDAEALDAIGRTFFAKPATFDALREHLKATIPRGDHRALAYTIRCRVPLLQLATDPIWGWPASADFALADDWLGRKLPAKITPAEQLVLRYLAAFGPATPADAQTWSGLQGLKEVFEHLRPRLLTFRDARKRELFDLPDAPRPPEDAPAPARFLPEYDNLVLSHQDRSRIIADAYRPRIVSANLMVRATFLVDGFVAGTWKVERTKKAAVLRLEPFGKLPKQDVAALEQEGERLLAFTDPDAATRSVTI